MISDQSKAYEFQKQFMNIMGIWPKREMTFFHKLKVCIVFGSTICLAAIMSMEFFNDLTDVIKLTAILYIYMSLLNYFLKVFSFWHHRKNFLDMLDFISGPMFKSYPPEFDRYIVTIVTRCQLLAKVNHYMAILFALGMGVYPFVDNQYLPLPFPYKVDNLRFYLYAFEAAALSIAILCSGAFDAFSAGLYSIPAAQLDILRRKIIVTLEVDDNDNYVEEEVCNDLKQCVQHHLAIIKFVEYINQIFGIGHLSQFLTSIIVICNTLFYIILVGLTSSQSIMMIDYLILLFIQLTLYCWFGNEIMLKSLQIHSACYNSEWYKHGSKVKRYVFIIMERSKKPVTVTAWKFVTLSLTSLMSTLQWSYSYFALLYKLYKKTPLSTST